MSHVCNPCERWEELGLGLAVVLYRRTQIVLSAARLLPAHRRLPHASFLSGLWWKLLSIQPARIVACLPHLQRFSKADFYLPTSFVIEGFSAGSYTGAVIALALRQLFQNAGSLPS